MTVSSAPSPEGVAWPKGRYYFLMALVLILGFAWITATRVVQPTNIGAQVPRPGFVAPDFALPTLDGDTIRLSDLRGRPVVINFWATWCPPCRTEMPAIIREYNRYKDRGLIVLAVNQAESPAKIIPFRDEYGMPFPILLDERMEVSKLYEIRFLPTTFFVAPNGTITDMVTGGMNEGAVRVHFQRLMKEAGQ